MCTNDVQIVANAEVTQVYGIKPLEALAKRIGKYGKCTLQANRLGFHVWIKVIRDGEPWTFAQFQAIQRALGGIVVATDWTEATRFSECTALVEIQLRPRFAYERKRCTYCGLTLAGGCDCVDLTEPQWATINAIEAAVSVTWTGSLRRNLIKQVKNGLTVDQFRAIQQATPDWPVEQVLRAGKPVSAPSLLGRLAQAWKEHGGGEFPYARAGRALKGVRLSVSDDVFVAGFHTYLMRTPGAYRSINRYLETYPEYAGAAQMDPGGAYKVDVF